MTYTYKCQICRIHFDGPNEKPVCPRCGSRYTERLLQRGNKKIKKIKKFAGTFVKVEKKRCKKCIHSEETATSATIKCTLPAPETTFRKEKNSWVCYSFSQKLNQRGKK